MAESIKFAVLDTDFVSKANIIHSGNRVLADEVLSFPNYKFFCHQKMKDELEDHSTKAAQEWLDDKISSKKIICYTDAMIIAQIKGCTGDNCFFYYRSFLKKSCELFSGSFYDDYFQPLDNWIENNRCSDRSFLSVLASCESEIGHRKNYGEIKAAVLTQTLKFLYDAETYVFCSDDFNARRGFANGAMIPCISILSVFLKMRLIGKKIEDIEPYFQSFETWCSNRKNPQTHVKVWEFKEGTYKRESVPIPSILTDMFNGKYAARKDGDLQKVTTE